MTATAETPALTVQTLDVTVNQTDLVGALQFVTKTTRVNRNAPHVLNGVLLESDNGLLTATRFDYEVASRQTIPAKGAGRALVGAHTLLDLVKDLDKGCEIALRADDRQLVVIGDGVTYRTPLLPIDDFPTAPAPGGILLTVFTASQLPNLPDVVTSAETDNTLPVLQHVSFGRNQDGNLELAATNRYHLSVWDTGLWIDELPDNQPLLVPTATTTEVARQFKGDDVLVSYALKPVRTVSFVSDNRSITVRQGDGRFPDYARLLPNPETLALVGVDRAALVKAAQQVTKIAARTTPIRLAIGTGTLTLRVREDDQSAEKTLSADAAADAPDVEIGANPGYLQTGLKAIGGNTVTIGFPREHPEGKPMLIRRSDRTDFRFLLMPYRLES